MTNRLLNESLRHAHTFLRKHPQYRHFLHTSYVVCGGQVVEWGYNRAGEPPVHFGYHGESKIHAELAAYRKGRGLINGTFSLINVRYNRSGMVKLAAPCQVCREWLAAVGCDTVWFTLDGGGWAKTSLQEAKG